MFMRKLPWIIWVNPNVITRVLIRKGGRRGYNHQRKRILEVYERKGPYEPSNAGNFKLLTEMSREKIITESLQKEL